MKTESGVVAARADRLDLLDDPGPQILEDVRSLQGRDILEYLDILYVNETTVDYAPFTDFLEGLLQGADSELMLAAAQVMAACVPAGVARIRGLDLTLEQRERVIPFVDLFLAPWFEIVLEIEAVDA